MKRKFPKTLGSQWLGSYDTEISYLNTCDAIYLMCDLLDNPWGYKKYLELWEAIGTMYEDRKWAVAKDYLRIHKWVMK